LIAFVAAQGWDYRLRLKGNVLVFIKGCKSRLDQHAAGTLPYLHDIQLTHRRVTTNIGTIYDPGHDEPWFIAMLDKPGFLTTLDYSERRGIEPMFSDCTSCCHGIGCRAERS
jgi:hypothetical protein